MKSRYMHITQTAFGPWVRIERDGAMIASKLFSVRSHGTKKAATSAAVAFRDSVYLKHNIDRNNPRKSRMHVKAGRRNSSGYPGVAIEFRKRERGLECHCVATWFDHETNKQHRKTYSIKKYGLSEAWRLAYKERMTHQKVKRFKIPVPPLLTAHQKKLIKTFSVAI